MYEIAEAIEPDPYLALARATFGEMALAGITAVGEFHYLHHGPGGARYEDPNAMGRAVIDAAREAGIRITLLDTCYLHGGIGQEAEGVQLRFSDGTAEAWAERVDGLEADAGGARRRGDPQRPRGRPGGRGPGGGVRRRAILAAPRPRLRAAGRERGLRLRLREDPDRAARRTPAPSRSASPRSTPRIWSMPTSRCSAAAGCGVCLCPTTERDLADGVGPARRLAEAGARSPSAPTPTRLIDMFEEARAVELDERLESGDARRPSAAELLARRDRGRLRRHRLARGRQDRARRASPTW